MPTRLLPGGEWLASVKTASAAMSTVSRKKLAASAFSLRRSAAWESIRRPLSMPDHDDGRCALDRGIDPEAGERNASCDEPGDGADHAFDRHPPQGQPRALPGAGAIMSRSRSALVRARPRTVAWRRPAFASGARVGAVAGLGSAIEARG